MTTATITPDARFDDPTAWDEANRPQPVFMAHEAWAYTDKDGKPLVQDGMLKFAAVRSGQTPPPGTKCAYKIDANDLEKIKSALIRRTESGLPLPIFIGHRKPMAAETEQPPLVGYGVGAELVDHSGEKLLTTKRFIRKGAKEKYNVDEYPQASPDFDPVTGEITGIALLKNEPKLPMPMVIGYAKGEKIVVAQYQGGFDGPTVAPEPEPEEDDKPDPTSPPDQDELGDDPKQSSEAKLAFELLMKVPTFAEMVRSFEASKAPPPPTDPQPAAASGGAPPVAPPDDLPPVQMKKDVMSAQYQKTIERHEKQIADLQKENRKLHAERLLQEAKEKGVLFTYQKEFDRMVGMPTNAERDEHLQHMIACYKTDEARALSSDAPDVKTKTMLPSEKDAKPDIGGERLGALAAQYCKQNGLEVTNPDHWMQAVAAIKQRQAS